MGKIWQRLIYASLAVLFLLSVVSFPTTPAYAVTHTYYVSTTGNDANDGLGPGNDHAWQTIQHGVDEALAGDTVYVRAGTYNEWVWATTIAGMPGQPITFKNYVGESPIIDGTGLTDFGYTGLITITMQYITFDGFEVRNSIHSGVYVEYGNHATLKNLTIHDADKEGIDAAVCNNLLIDGVEVYDSVSSGYNESISIIAVDTFEIKNSSSHDNFKEGICIKNGSSNGLVHDNDIYHIPSDGIYIDNEGIATSNIAVYNNKFHDMLHQEYYTGAFFDGNGISLGSEISPASMTGISIYNNLIYNTGRGFVTYPAAFNKTFTLINNTFYNNFVTGDIQVLDPHANNINCVIRNNIISENTSGINGITYADYAAGGVTVDHNLFYNSGGSWGAGNVLGTDYLTGDPLFTSPTTDFSIPVTSPAADTGSSTSAPSTDYIGTARPQNTVYDRGAYEFLGSPPSPPTNVAASDGTSTTNVTVTWTASAGATGYRVYRNNVDVSGLLGAVTTYYDTGAAAGIITPGTASATDGTNTANVTLTVSGQSVANGTSYSYTVRAVGSGGTSGDSSSNTGYRGVGSLTYQWWRSAADSDTGYSVLTGATTATYVDTTAPAPTLSGGTATASDGTDTTNVNLSVTGTTASGAGRYYACALSATGATNATTTTDRGYRAVSGITYQWFATSTDSDMGYAAIGGATTATWAYDAAPDPTITAGAAVASDNLSTNYVYLSLSGSAANAGAGRWFLCQVTAGGTSANSTHNRGYVGVGTLTIQWQQSAADSDAAYSNIPGGITNPYNNSTAPANGDGRYYKALLTASGATSANTTADRGFRQVAVTVPSTGNTMGDVLGWAMIILTVAGIFAGAKNAPRA